MPPWKVSARTHGQGALVRRQPLQVTRDGTVATGPASRAAQPLQASDAPAGAQRAAFASATVSAVMLTMRRTVVLAVRMWTGLAAPSSTGPMAMLPPAAVLSRL